MITGNLFIVIVLTYYTSYLVEIIFSKTKRKNVQVTNDKLDNLRKIGYKTLEQQKNFLNLKYPKKPKFKWRWSIIPYVLYRIFLFVVLFRFWWWISSLSKINFAIWHGILFMVLFPIVLNLVLERFKVHRGDLSIYFKGWFK